MSVKNELHCIEVELKSIEESQERIKLYASELNKLNPLKVGQELVVTGYSHQGKTLVAERIFVSDQRGYDVEVSAQEPVYFSAVGAVKKKNGELGVYSGVHNIELSELVNDLDN